jgi:hypothetical protein
VNGIAKVFKDDNEIKFVDIESHNENLKRIAEAISEDFTGNKRLLIQASAIHDLWKSATIRPEAILSQGSLFKGHSTQFPANFVNSEFDDIEFDRSIRKRHFDDYYVLNLVRLHHSGLSTYALYRNVDFIFETFEKDRWKIIELANAFIKDWYALMTADWIDSAIMGSLLNAKDLEFYLTSEISLGRRDETEFYVIQDDFLKTDVTLSYKYVNMPVNEVKRIIHSSRQREALNKEFLSRLESAVEKKVYLRGT